MVIKKKPTFEESIEIIDTEIKKRHGKWTLTCLASMDYDDVSQILRLHIWKKWHLYNPERPLVNWLNVIISNQIRNLVRNNFSIYSKPCNSCPHSVGDNSCELYDVQCEACPLYAKWLKYKKHAHDIKLPVPIENHEKEVCEFECQHSDVEKSIPELHKRIEPLLKPYEWQVYKWCFIEHLDDEVIVEKMGYGGSKFKKGLKYLNCIRKTIAGHANKIVYSEDFEI